MTMRAIPRSRIWPTLILGRGSPPTAATTAPVAFERRRRSLRDADGFGNFSTCARTSSMSRSSLLDITSRGALFRSYHSTPPPSPLEGRDLHHLNCYPGETVASLKLL